MAFLEYFLKKKCIEVFLDLDERQIFCHRSFDSNSILVEPVYLIYVNQAMQVTARICSGSELIFFSYCSLTQHITINSIF